MLGLRITIILLGLLAFVFIACTPGGRYWMRSAVSTLDANIGLWDTCVNDVCKSYDDANIDTPDYVEAVRGMTIISTIFAAIGLVFSVIMAIPNCCDHRIFDLIQFLFYIAAALFEFLSIIVYASEHENGGFVYGWTFMFAGVGFAFAVPAAVVPMYLFCSARPVRTGPSDQELQPHK